MKWVLELLLFIAVSLLGVKLMGAVITQRDAEVWLRQPDGSELHLKGVDVSHPFFGGLQVRTPDGRVTTYPNAALVSLAFEPQPYSWPEKLEMAGIVLAVLAVWLLIAWPDLRWFGERLNRRRV
jgi:hypothetical protein